MLPTVTTGYAPVNGVDVYWESRGQGGPPLIAVHGGFGLTTMFGDLLDRWAERRQVVAVELQGHGHTADTDRPFRYRAFGDEVAGVIDHLGLGRVDLLGYSLGGQVCLRCAIQHPEHVRRLVVVSAPYARLGWFPEVRAAFDQMGRAGFAGLRHSPMYAAWAEVAPDADAFPDLMDKTGDLQRQPYDWADEVEGLRAPTLLVFGDADSVPPSHAAAFFALLGGGLRDPGWDGSAGPRSRLAVLPGRTHYDILDDPGLATMVDDFTR